MFMPGEISEMSFSFYGKLPVENLWHLVQVAL
jgi:hypothetical protein